MRSLIELNYHTIGDAVQEFGTTAAIREMFVGFQNYLYGQIHCSYNEDINVL